MLLGGYLTLLIGPTLPLPAAPFILDHLEGITVTHNEVGRSGFEITLGVGRDRMLGMLDYPALLLQAVRIGHRVQIYVTVNGRPTMLMDGIITNYTLNPSEAPNGSKLSIVGEDVSVMMNLREKQRFFPGLADDMIARLILAEYATYSVVPKVMLLPKPPPSVTDGTPTRTGTDLQILEAIAQRHHAAFYIDPLSIPGVNTAYLGPPLRAGVPQRALTFGMGAASNVTRISFGNDGTRAAFVEGVVQPTRPDAKSPPMPPIPIVAPPLPLPPLAAIPALVGNAPFVSSKLVTDHQQGDIVEVLTNALLQASSSTNDAATASGELDVARYGEVLKPRGIVAVRGVGLTFDGFWYVKSVTHQLGRGSYKQQFNLERDGTMPLSPVVPT